MKEIYAKQAVLYSFEQQAFHIESLGDYCKSNIQATITKKPHEYRLIGVADDYQQASEYVKQLRSKFNW